MTATTDVADAARKPHAGAAELLYIMFKTPTSRAGPLDRFMEREVDRDPQAHQRQ